MTTRSCRCVSILAIALLAGLAGCAQEQNAEKLKKGWNRDKRLDLNTAIKAQLMVLPGMTSAEADKVIAGRPYENTGELVMRGILPKNEYDKIADRVTARIWHADLCSAGQAENCMTHFEPISRAVADYQNQDSGQEYRVFGDILALWSARGSPTNGLINLSISSPCDG